ncbi:MAG: MurR/RpiR family transcriptional regulator, partial [Spirochaetia bacterium]|nr:MurR/RpiR family transcriptional regulator [Spirochaetia bacterium]
MVLAKIRDSLSTMPSNFHKIGSYILDHEQNVAFASIYAISQAVGVSNASLVRFAKSLGLDGYQALKREVQDEIKHRLGPYDKIALQELDSLPEEKRLQKLYMSEINNLRNTFDKIQPETIETMAENLRTARRIFVCGFGASGYLAKAFEYTLISSINKEVTLITGSVSDYAPRLRSFGVEDVMFIMTFPPYSDEIRHVAQVVINSGGRLNLFTNSA